MGVCMSMYVHACVRIYMCVRECFYPLSKEICCFRVPYNGDTNESKLLVEEATLANVYKDDYIFDCDNVRGRVTLYRSEFYALCN